MDFSQEYFDALGGTATALLVLGTLFTWLITFRLNRTLERFKSELQRDLSKHNLLYPERASLVRELDLICRELKDQAHTYLAELEYGKLETTLSHEYKTLDDKARELRHCLPKCKLLLPDEGYDAIDSLARHCSLLLSLNDVTHDEANKIIEGFYKRIPVIEKLFKEFLGSDKI